MPADVDPVFTLSDLETWSNSGTCLAVLGHPIAHSLSPPMHNAALAALARTDSRYAEWRYFRFEIHPGQLPRALDLLHAQKFCGINLTVPHKIIAFGRVADIDPPALPAGAVNTLLWRESGWSGFNTDGYGLAAAVRETLDLDLGQLPILLVGAGGAARGAAIQCLQSRCASLWVANRTAAHLDALLQALTPFADGVPLHGFAPDDPPTSLPPGTLVINATSSGLKPGDSPPIDLARLPRPAAVYDMIYNPPQTPLLLQAASLGIPHANGLSMLVHQGAKALEIWSGASASRLAPVMASAARAALEAR